MSDLLYSFISFLTHYSFYYDIFIPSVFSYFYSDANKQHNSRNIYYILLFFTFPGDKWLLEFLLFQKGSLNKPSPETVIYD